MNKKERHFGDTELGQGIGCGFVILAIGVALFLFILAGSLIK